MPTQTLVIDSKHRDEKSSIGSHAFDLKLGPENTLGRFRWVSARPKWIRIPYSWYTVNEDNNTFQWDDTAANPHTTTVPVGYYTADELATAIGVALTADGAGTYTATYSDLTGKMTITEAAGNWELTAASANSTIHTLLGFSATTLTGNTAYTGDMVVDLNHIKSLHVISNLPVSNLGLRPDGTSAKELLSVPVDVLTGSTLNRALDEENSMALSGYVPNTLSFEIQDEAGNLIDLNGANWSMAIVLSSSGAKPIVRDWHEKKYDDADKMDTTGLFF